MSLHNLATAGPSTSTSGDGTLHRTSVNVLVASGDTITDDRFRLTDPACQRTYTHIPQEQYLRSSGVHAQEAINQNGNHLLSQTKSMLTNFLVKEDAASFARMFLLPSEQLTDDLVLPYSSIEFWVPDEHGQAHTKVETLTHGCATLTNERLLLLSTTSHTVGELEKYRNPKHFNGGYSVDVYSHDTRLFWPLPLSSLLTLKIFVNAGSLAMENTVNQCCLPCVSDCEKSCPNPNNPLPEPIDAEKLFAKRNSPVDYDPEEEKKRQQKPCGQLFCSYLGKCNPMAGWCNMFNWVCHVCCCCCIRWKPEPIVQVSQNDRLLEICMTMPPWHAKRIVRIHIDPKLPMTQVNAFVVRLQASMQQRQQGGAATVTYLNVVNVPPGTPVPDNSVVVQQQPRGIGLPGMVPPRSPAVQVVHVEPSAGNGEMKYGVVEVEDTSGGGGTAVEVKHVLNMMHDA